MMLGQPDRLEAHLVGQPAFFQRVLVDFGVGLPVAQREEVLNPEFHGVRISPPVWCIKGGGVAPLPQERTIWLN